MVVKSVAIGVILFLFDLLIYVSAILKGTKKRLPKAELTLLKARFGFSIPIALFIQVFFGLVLVYTYQFLLSFSIVVNSFAGSFAYAFIFFIPMLFLLLNSWLWGDQEFNDKLVPSMISWLVKFAAAGLLLGILI